MGVSFLSPLFLAGLLAVGIPVVIHLMQRKRARVVDFGTLRFLKEVHAKLSMRQKIREMILLALRCLLILLIVAAMARPVLRGEAFQGNEDAPVTMVFIVDNTLSMTAQVGGVSNFERARSLLKAEAKAMDNDDRMMVLPFLELPAENGGRTVNRPLAPGPVLTTAINELRQGYGRGEPLSVLREAKELIADSDTLNREIYILSDFQSTTFERFNSQAIAEEIKEFGENVAVYAVDLSSRDLRSAAPRRGYFRSSGPSGDSTKVCGEVVNFSREKFDIKISLMIDGVKEAQQMYSLKSEERWPFEFDVTFSDMGFHKVAVLLEGDDIPGDNSLNLSFFSSPQLEVLLVNGRPSSVSSIDAAYYLRCALEPRWKSGQNGLMGITTRAVNAAEFTQESIGDAKVVYLLDVPAVSPAARDALVALVRSGGGLVLVPGPMTETGSYNTIIRSGFEPVLPAMARDIAGEENRSEYFVNFASLSLQHPVWAGIQEKALQLLCAESLSRVLHLETNPAVAEKETFCELNNSWPAIVASRYGSGRIVQFAFPLDTQWSSLPLRPVFPLLCHRTTHYAAGTLSGLQNSVQVGKPLTMFLRRSTGEMKFRVTYPSGDIELQPVLRDDGFYVEAPAPAEPGFVRFHELASASFEGQLIAVNTPADESKPAFLAASDITEEFGDTPAYAVDDPGELATVRKRLKSGSPLWGYLLICTLLLLGLESWLGNSVLKRISAGKKAQADNYGVLSRKAIMNLRKRRNATREAS